MMLMKMKLELWLKHHSASKSKFNLEILHTLKGLHIAGLFLFKISKKSLLDSFLKLKIVEA